MLQRRLQELSGSPPTNGANGWRERSVSLAAVTEDKARRSEDGEMLNAPNGTGAKGAVPQSYSPSPELQLRVPSRTTTPNGSMTPLKSLADEGYRKYVFSGKKNQALEVEKLVLEKGFIPEQLVHNEGAVVRDGTRSCSSGEGE